MVYNRKAQPHLAEAHVLNRTTESEDDEQDPETVRELDLLKPRTREEVEENQTACYALCPEKCPED